MLKTQAEIQKEVRDYLLNLPHKSKNAEDYTLSKISEVVSVDVTQVENALKELENEKIINSRRIQLQVYVPKNKYGFEVLAGFAKKEFITYSPYWAIVFGFVMLGIVVLSWEPYFIPPNELRTLTQAYLQGIKNGTLYSFIVGLLGGILIENLLSRFRCWQIVSEEAYEKISSLTKFIAIISIIFIGIYIIATDRIGQPVDLSIVATLFGASAGLGIAYKTFMDKKK